MIKLGDYVKINEGNYYQSISDLIFKVIVVEDDNDRVIIAVCNKTRANQEQNVFISSRFSREHMCIEYLESSFEYLEDDFEDILSEDEWNDDNEDEDLYYEDDYCPRTKELSLLVNTRDLKIAILKKGNTKLF